MTLPSLPAQGSTSWYPWAAAIDEAVRNGGSGLGDAEGIRDTIAATLIAGAGVAIAPDDVGDTIVISATGGAALVHVNDSSAAGDGSTDDTAALQSFIDDHAGKLLYFPEKTYNVTQLLLPNNTHLELGNAVIRRAGTTSGSGANATIRNSDFDGGNTNITIRGGTLSSASGASGRVWHMQNVSGLRVQNLTIEKGSSSFADFMMSIYGSDNVQIDNCRIKGGTDVGEDGIHIKSSQRVAISNCLVEAGDDALVLVQEFNQTEPLKHVTVDNCVLNSRSAHFIRISVFAGETQPIEDVTITNVVCHAPTGGTIGGNSVLVNDATDTGLVRRINMSGITVNATGKAGNAVSITNVVDSTFSNWRVSGAANRSFLITNCDRLTFTGCVADTPAASTGNPQWSILGGSTALTFMGCESRASRIWGWVIGDAGTADIAFVGCKAYSNAQQAWSISYAARVSIIGCTVLGGAAPITCDTTNPPTDLKVIGNNFTGYSGTTAVSNPPASLTYTGNVDLATRGDQFPNTKLGFYGTTPIAKPTGVAVTAAGVHAALVSLGLISA